MRWLLALLLPALAFAGEIDLAPFPQELTGIYDWMGANGWESKRNDPGRWEIAEGRLHMVSDYDSVLIGTERGFPRDTKTWSKLSFKVRVAKVPKGTDLSRKSGDDAAFRVYVGFDRGGGIFSPPNTIAYTWTENVPAGKSTRSAYGKRLHYLSIGMGPTGESWVTVKRDMLADYRRLFPKDRSIPPIKAVLIKCDTNNTGGSAEAWLSDLKLSSP